MKEPKYSRRQTIVKFHDQHSWNWHEIAELLRLPRKKIINEYHAWKNRKKNQEKWVTPWKQRNREKVKAIQSRWSKKNGPRVNAYNTSWRRRHPNNVRAMWQRRKEKLRSQADASR